MSEEQLDASVESGLSDLINLTGKLRMLSHRTVMFAAMMSADAERQHVHLEAMGKALGQFTEIYVTLIKGNTSLGVSEACIEVLQRKGGISEKDLDPMRKFLTDADLTKEALMKDPNANQALIALSAFVSGTLLNQLNALNDRVRETLSQYWLDQSKKREESRGVVEVANNQLRDIGRMAQILSINVLLETKRLGEAGKGMEFVAAEMIKITKSVTGLTDEIGGFLKSLKS